MIGSLIGMATATFVLTLLVAYINAWSILDFTIEGGGGWSFVFTWIVMWFSMFLGAVYGAQKR